MKTIWLLRAVDRNLSDAESERAAKVAQNAAWPRDALRVSLLLALPGRETDAPADLLIQLWSEETVALPEDLVRAVETRMHVTRLEIEERVRKDVRGWSGSGDQPGVSLLAFCGAPDGQARQETLRHWSEHVRLAVTIHHGAERYIQNVVLGDHPWFGIAELLLADADDLPGQLFRSPADADEINEDVAEFVALCPTLLAREHVVRA
jgi:hypothetical protein